MSNYKSLVVASLVFSPLLAWGDAAEPAVADEKADEIVVVGRSVATSATRIEVERELLVDTATALRDIPGATVNRNGPITGIAQYRGVFGDRVAVDIDQQGLITGGPNAMDAPLSYMSPMMTGELVVSRGIASVSLAPEAIGGHVATTTSRGEFGAEKFGLSGMLGTRFSENGDISATAARLTIANVRHRVSAIAEFDTGSDIDTPEGAIRPSKLDRDRYDLSYAYAGERHSIDVYAGKLDTGDSGTPALPMDIVFIDTEMYGARLTADVSPNLTIEGRFRYNDVAHEMDNFSLREGPPAMMRRLNTAQGSGSQFFLAATTDLDQSVVEFGVDGVRADHASVITNPGNELFRIENFTAVERNLLGGFVEWVRLAGPAELEAGLRINRITTAAGEVGAAGLPGMMGDQVSQLASSFNAARRGLEWTTFDAVVKYRRPMSTRGQWNIEVGTKSRAPSYQELYLWLPMQATGGLADGRTYIGDLDLDAEQSVEVVVGLSAEVGSFTASPQVYFRRVDDFIQGVPSADATANGVATMMTGVEPLQFANVDAEFWGFDAAWSYELSESLLLDGTISLVRGERRDINDHLYRLSPFNGSIGVTYTSDTWSLKSELIGYADQDRVSLTNSETATPGYWLVNLGFRWRPAQSLRVDARVDNLLDESYQNHVTGINRARGSDIPAGQRLYGAGRTVSAGLVYTF